MNRRIILLTATVLAVTGCFFMQGCIQQHAPAFPEIASIQADTTVLLKPEVETSPDCRISIDFMYLKPASPTDSVSEAVNRIFYETVSEKTAGARMKKYELDASATNDGKLQSNDIVLFRYADVLLMKSEAKVRNGGNGDAELTEVRERAGATLDVTATLETLLEERLREFAWEGLRRQDLVRFGKFTRAYTDRPQLPKEDTGYTTVFPIHEDVLSLNGKLTQNYGY